MPFTKPQQSFQPSSSPVHLQHRFMVRKAWFIIFTKIFIIYNLFQAWNDLGLIRNYEIEDDELGAIDIEFHDVSFHNAIHLRNQHDYTIAALGKEAVIFASSKRNSPIR
jgi:hypothetical protein